MKGQWEKKNQRGSASAETRQLYYHCNIGHRNNLIYLSL